MKKNKIIVTFIAIVLFTLLSAFLIFKLPTDNADNKRVIIGLVNEDEGVSINNQYLSYGERFIESFQENDNYDYSVTSRTNAFNGLDDNSFDVVLIIPNIYSKNLLSYKDEQPQQAMIEYYTSKEIKQIEYLKNKLSSFEIKELINQTMIKSYNKEILHTFQDMQNKSMEVLKGQSEYNDIFKADIEKPMNETYSEIDTIMSSSKSQQDFISEFGIGVNTFSFSVIDLINEENRQRNELEILNIKNAETNETIKEQQKNIEDLKESLGSQDVNLKSLNKLIMLNQSSLEDIVRKLEEKNNDLSGIIESITKHKTEMSSKASIYDQIAKLIKSEGMEFNDSMFIAPEDLDKEEQDNYQKLVGEIVPSFMNIINSITTDMLYAKLNNDILKTKDYVESKIINKCKMFSESNLVNEPKLKEYCKSFIELNPVDQYKDMKYRYSYEKEFITNDEGMLTILFDDVVDGKNVQVLINNENIEVENNKIEYDLTTDPKIKLEILFYANQDSTNDKFKIDVNDQSEDIKIPQYYQEIKDNQLNSDIIEVKTLIKLYYGKDINDLLASETMSRLASDESEVLNGIKKYRTKYTKDSLLYTIEQNELDIKGEIGVAFANEFQSVYQNFAEDLDGYIQSIEGIYNVNKMEIENLDKQNLKIADLINNFSIFYDEYEIMQHDLNNIATKETEISDMNSGEATIITSLSTNQLNLLEGFKYLQGTISEQEKQVEDIQKEAKLLSKDVDTMQKNTEEYQKKVATTQDKFLKLTKENKTYVEQFNDEYVNTKINGKDNNEFYNNIVAPVDIVSEESSFNIGSLIPFYLVTLLSVFSLINAYFSSNLKIKAKEKSAFEHKSIYQSINKKLTISLLISLIVGVIVAYIGLQALNFNIINTALWLSLIILISIVLSLVFFALLERFKTFGMMIIGLFLILYLVSNSALGLSNTSLSILSTLKMVNPLILLEMPLQQVVSGSQVNLFLIILSSLIFIALSLLIIYLFRKEKTPNETAV